MANNKDYQVNYTLNVKAGEGISQLNSFSTSVKNLVGAQKDISTATTSINKMFDNLNTTFGKGNKKNYTLGFNTKVGEKQLDKIISKLDTIQSKANAITLNVLSGNVDQKDIRARMAAYAKARVAAERAADKKDATTATSALKTASKTAANIISSTKMVNTAIGKTLSAMHKLQSGVDVNLKTDRAKARLNELITLMRQLKKEANINVNMFAGTPTGGVRGARGGFAGTAAGSGVAYMPMSAGGRRGFRSAPNYSNYASSGISGRTAASSWFYPTGGRPVASGIRMLGSNQATGNQARDSWRRYARQNGQYVPFTPVPNYSWSGGTAPWSTNPYVANPNRSFVPLGGMGGSPSASNGRTNMTAANSMQKAAMNRLQYSQMPTWRALPFAGMLNAYFMYNAFKQELGDAIEFTHVMSSAENVLRATDTDMATFQERFSSMTSHVRKIGVDTRFTMVEMAKATKFLAQAGFSTDQIRQSIRPISDLALVSDTPIQDIADKVTGIIHGFGIKTESTSVVADQLANVANRSNTTIPDMAEAFKMSAGFMNMAGVDFSEAAAAIGILGNNGIKGTMAGTSLRSMMTYFAKPSKNAKRTIDRLGVSFTEDRDVYGKQVNKLRSLADIFEDLHKAGATAQDMATIFGKIGGNGAMALVKRSSDLRTLTDSNLTSHGVAHELGAKQQDTTSGLWQQLSSQWSEAFTKAYENLEPVIRLILKDLMSKFSSREFADGIKVLGESMLSVFNVVSKVGSWIATNWSWLEPFLVTGVAAKMIFKTAGALTNLAVAFGVVAKTSMMASGLGVAGAFTSIVSNATASTAAVGGTTAAVSNLGRTFASTINTGSGVTGAAAAIGAFGTSAIVATGLVSVLIASLGYAGYKAYQLHQRKEALKEEMGANTKYYYPSIEALNSALKEAYKNAILAKEAKDDLTDGATVGDVYKNVTGGSFWDSVSGGLKSAAVWLGMNSNQGYRSETSNAQSKIAELRRQGKPEEANKVQTALDLANSEAANPDYQTKVTNYSEIAARKQAQNINDAEWVYLVNNSKNAVQAEVSLKKFKNAFKPTVLLNPDLYVENPWTGGVTYKAGFDKLPAINAMKTPAYVNASNKLYEEVQKGEGYGTAAQMYVDALKSREKAESLVFGFGVVSENDITEGGYERVKDKYVPIQLGRNASEKERYELSAAQDLLRNKISTVVFPSLKQFAGGQGKGAAAILEKMGIGKDLYSNKVISDSSSLDTNDFSNEDGTSGSSGGYGGAGGNYGGSGKVSSAAPKQVNVTITNLMSIETIKLMSTEDGKNPVIQDLKEQLTQVLLGVVHDFDSSWNA